MDIRQLDLRETIPSRQITTLGEWSMLREVAWGEYEVLRRAIDAISSGGRSAPLRLYRGESKANLRFQLLSDPSLDVPDSVLYTRLFYFGEKARHFSLDDDHPLSRRTWLTRISDVEDETFAWLFDRIQRIINYRRSRVRKFCTDNPEFVAFFSTPEYRSYFLSIVRRLHPVRRAHLRDYYLYFLHTYGRRGIHKETVLVSTSECLAQARRFAGRGDEGVVLHIFLPHPLRFRAVSSFAGAHAHPVASFRGLPTYRADSGLYQEQREVALRGAIFPQFILGVEDSANNQFIVNPHLLQMTVRDVAKIRTWGIPVDQRGFDLLVQETGFRHYTSVDGRGRYTEFCISGRPSVVP